MMINTPSRWPGMAAFIESLERFEGFTINSEMYEAYRTWAARNGHPVASHRVMTRNMLAAGVVLVPRKNRFWVNVRPRA